MANNVWVSKLDLKYNTGLKRADGLKAVYKDIAKWADAFGGVDRVVVYDGIDISNIARIVTVVMSNDKAYTYKLSAAKGYASLQRVWLSSYGFETKDVIFER